MLCNYRHRLILPLLLLCCFSSFAWGEESEAAPESQGLLPLEDYSGDLMNRSRLTGDWGGARALLAEKGVTLEVDWAQYFMAVVDGGNDRKFEYGGTLDYTVNLDLHRMGVMPGALVKFRAESVYGESLSDEAGVISPVNVDMLFPLTNNAEDNITTITNVIYTQFLSETLGIMIGKFDTLDGDANEFGGHRGTRQFMNTSFVLNPVTGITTPYSTLGIGLLWMPNENVLLNVNLIDSEDSSTTTGFDTVFDDGTTVAAELYLQYQLFGQPGGQMFGFTYAFNGDFVILDAKQIKGLLPNVALATESDSWSVYWNLWQYIDIDEGHGAIDVFDGRTERGWGVFVRAGLADEDTNPVQGFISVGVGGRGLISGRENDSFGVAYYYAEGPDGALATLVGLEGSGHGVEMYYDIALTPWMHLTPDLQIIDPALSASDTVVVVGGRLVISF